MIAAIAAGARLTLAGAIVAVAAETPRHAERAVLFRQSHRPDAELQADELSMTPQSPR